LARVDAGATLLVLDEPTAHLDRASADLVRAAIRRRAERAVVVLASHEHDTTALATMVVPVGVAAASARLEHRAIDDAASLASAADPSAADRGAADAPSAAPPAAEAPHAARTPAEGAPSSAAPGATEPQPAARSRAPRLTVRSLIRPHLAAWAGAIAMAAIAVAMGLSLTAVSGWLIVRASIEEHIMMLLLAIVGVRAFGIFRSVGRYADRLLTHDAAFKVVDELRLRLWRAIAARGAGSRRLLEGGAPLDYLVTLADELRDQLPRVLPPIAVGVLVIAGAGVTTRLVAPPLALVVVLTLALATAAAAALAIWSERGAAAARVGARSALV
ncbi:ABC transporter, partial [Agrococcus sp. HG114]|nr:ABC transporter [Agrococcus sp. HG114]